MLAYPKFVVVAGWMAVAGLLPLVVPVSSRAEFIWGVNGHPLISYPGVSIEQQVTYLRELGVSSYRVDVKAPESFPRLRQLVVAARQFDIDILPVLTPAVDLNKEDVDHIYAISHRLALEAAIHFNGEIPVWELGNELEGFAILMPCEKKDDGTQYPCEWGPAGGVTALEYHGPRWAKASAVLRGLADGIKAAGVSARVAMGTAGWGHTGAFERMRADGLDWDISVWHMYGEDPEWALKELAKYGKPIWITEFNHPNGSMNGEQAQAEGLSKWISRIEHLSRSYDIEAAHIYELMDETYWAPSYEAFMGLVRLEKEGHGWRPGEPKPAFFVVRDLLRGEGTSVLPQPVDTYN